MSVPAECRVGAFLRMEWRRGKEFVFVMASQNVLNQSADCSVVSCVFFFFLFFLLPFTGDRLHVGDSPFKLKTNLSDSVI